MSDFINTVDTLGDAALTSKIIDKSITEYNDNLISKVGDYAFYKCTALKSVNCPNATNIGYSGMASSAFEGCTALESVEFPEVTGIGGSVFEGCTVLASVSIPKLTTLGSSNIFRNCDALTSVDFPEVTGIGNYCFDGCNALASVNLPKITNIGQYGFQYTALTSVVFPLVTGIDMYAFRYCDSLKSADFTALTRIKSNAFQECTALKTLILRNASAVITLDAASALASTPIAGGTGYIYVPSALVDSYKADSNWSTFASQFRAIEDYSDDGTINGQIVLPVSFDSTDFSQGYSVEWDYSQSSTALTRTGLASGFSDPAPATSLDATGSSPFDSIMPWSGMKRYNVIDGAIAYSEDDAGFSMTDYDTVVYIPPFYYAAYKDEANTKWRWSISPVEKEGYALHPGSGRYIGRYHTSGDSSAVFSKSGVLPLVSTTRPNFRTYSHNKGDNWWMIDIATWSALQLLFLVEFADFHSQNKLGKGYGSDSQAFGSTDEAVYHTYNGGNTTNQYRWIEQPWGRCYDWVDGFMVSAMACYLGTNNSTFTDATTNLKAADVTLPSSQYITGFGYSNKFPWAMLPDAASDGGTSTYVPDYVNSNFGACALFVGGSTSHNDTFGLFFFNAYYDASNAFASLGSRLIFIP